MHLNSVGASYLPNLNKFKREKKKIFYVLERKDVLWLGRGDHTQGL
jgi:hypothetical protein